jgi:hypothetical protein
MFVSSRRHRATVQVEDSPTRTRRPPACHYCQTPAARRSTCRRGRIRVAETPVGHQQPHAAAGAEPQFVRSLRFGSWITVRSGKPTPQASRRPEAQDLVEFPRGAQREPGAERIGFVGRRLGDLINDGACVRVDRTSADVGLDGALITAQATQWPAQAEERAVGALSGQHRRLFWGHVSLE